MQRRQTPGPFEPSPLGRLLRKLRLQRGYSQPTLAAMAGVHRATVAELEIGRRKTARTDTARALALALGEDAGALLRN